MSKYLIITIQLFQQFSHRTLTQVNKCPCSRNSNKGILQKLGFWPVYQISEGLAQRLTTVSDTEAFPGNVSWEDLKSQNILFFPPCKCIQAFKDISSGHLLLADIADNRTGISVATDDKEYSPCTKSLKKVNKQMRKTESSSSVNNSCQKQQKEFLERGKNLFQDFSHDNMKNVQCQQKILNIQRSKKVWTIHRKYKTRD